VLAPSRCDSGGLAHPSPRAGPTVRRIADASILTVNGVSTDLIMPYRRSYRRSSRRSFGRRRRYGRRRPSTGRSVPRTTFAPRHQYLKLRMDVDTTAVGSGAQLGYLFVCDRMQESFLNPIQFPAVTTTFPLGYTEYGNLFSKYIVHGVKLNLWLRYRSGSANKNTLGVGDAYSTLDGTSTPASLVGSAEGIAAYPLGRFGVVTPERPYRIRRYMNNSKVAGVDVRKFDRFTKLWQLTSTDANTCFVGWTLKTDSLPTGDSVTFCGTVTYYVSAVAIQQTIGGAAAAAALVEMTDPLKEDFGEPRAPLQTDHGEFLKSGVAHSKRTLEDMNMGGTK